LKEILYIETAEDLREYYAERHRSVAGAPTSINATARYVAPYGTVRLFSIGIISSL